MKIKLEEHFELKYIKILFQFKGETTLEPLKNAASFK